jgi:hypothetical protein
MVKLQSEVEYTRPVVKLITNRETAKSSVKAADGNRIATNNDR